MLPTLGQKIELDTYACTVRNEMESVVDLWAKAWTLIDNNVFLPDIRSITPYWYEDNSVLHVVVVFEVWR